jgi:Right handed beta helix region
MTMAVKAGTLACSFIFAALLSVALSGCSQDRSNSVGITSGASSTPGSVSSSVAAPSNVNGSCGSSNGVAVSSAPTTGLCSAGTASAVGGTSPWSWMCAGSNGGRTAQCSAPHNTGAYASPTLLPEIDITYFGAKGDGKTDDTNNVQKALSYCSDRGSTCIISANKSFLITQPLFLWGNAKLQGTDGSGALVFNVTSAPYLLNIGISGKSKLETPFGGEISKVTFKVIGGDGGRVIFFWRTDGATIKNNTFTVGEYAYSATSSGNNNSWVINGFENCIRKNVQITENKIFASARELGSEGIGLENFDGAVISNNEIVGVGDDPVGIHFSNHITVENNKIKSVHGRVFISNSSNIEISHNDIERISSLSNNEYYAGIALIYIGFENQESNSFPAPSHTQVHDNYLYYPQGTLDAGAAIYLNSVRTTTVENNHIVNDSEMVIATAVHLLPQPFTGPWNDPDHVEFGNIASVGDVDILGNISDGTYPLGFVMTGPCTQYTGTVLVQDNLAANFAFYCNKTALLSNRRN